MSTAAAPTPLPTSAPSPGPARPLPRRRGAFALQASVLIALLAASSAPTPLYAIYQAEWHFSALTVTIVFSAYALALLAALLVAGSLSDYVGRRPVLVVSLLAEAAAMAAFAGAHGVGWLIAARIVQGLATGAATAAAGAALLDFEHPGRPGRAALANSATPVAGMAAGVLVSTALVQFAPAPTRTVYLLLIALFAAQAAAVALTPETADPHPGGWRSLRPGIAVAPSARRTLLVAAPAVIAAWALGGFYSSLGPSLARTIAPTAPRATGGLLFFAMALGAAVTVVATRPLRAHVVGTAGTAALIPGALLTLSSPHLHSLPVLFVGTMVSGAGFGAVSQGTIRRLLPLTTPEERAGTLAAYYVVSYLAMSVPAILAGVLTSRYGLTTAVSLYAGAVVLLVLATLAVLPLNTRRCGTAS